MSLSFANATGNLLNRLGRLGKVIANAKSSQTTQQTALIDLTNGIVGQFNSEPDLQSLIGGVYIGLINNIGSTFGGTMQSIAQTTINRMVYRDNPRISQNLTSINLLDSVNEVIRQMKAANATVLAMTLAATPAAFAATMNGNGVVNASVKRPSDGLVLENAFAENLLFTCTTDAYNGGATSGNETFTVNGVGNQGDFFAFDWPLGSNASTSINAIDGNTDNGSDNLLTNSGFTDWTAGALDNWTVVLGGSQFSQEVALSYDGGSALKITGNNTTNISIKQEFDNGTNGTSAVLDAVTQFSVNLFARRDGTAAGTGVLTIELIDENSNVVLDENNVANSFTIDLTALTVNYQSFTGVFRTPYILPTTLYLRMRISTALTTGRAVYLDKLSMGTMTQLYTSGPFVAVHAGSVQFRQNDFTTCAITNSRGAAGTLNTWQTLFSRLVPLMYSQELLLPSSATPSISDNLITN